jgi:hypothetical protein
MAQQTLNAGSPPIVWSTVEDAFTKINANFDELYGSIGGPGGVLDFTSLSTDIKPSASEVYDLGSPTARWRDLYLAGSSLYLGSAQITADGAGIVNLPLGTTINGQLVIDPANTAFKTFSVAGQSNIVADSVVDTLTVAAGNSGITLTTNATTDTLTITNSGVIDLAGTVGQIGVNIVSGVATLTNLGVLSLTGEAGGIGVSGSTGGITLTNLGVKQIVGTASQIGVSGDGTGIVTITNLAPASPTFRFIVVDGATLQPVAADNISDTLNLISGPGLTITKDTATDTLTFSVNSNLDIRGSVFADDSTMLVDATNGVLRGTLIGTVVGDLKGSIFGDDSTKIVDAVENKVYAEFFGNLTGNVTGNSSSATVSTTLDITDTNGLTTVYYPTFVENRTTGQTVRADIDLSYRTDTNTLTVPNIAGNLTGSVTGNIFTSLIDSSDSSAITVTPKTIFSSDVNVENELTVSNGITFSDGSVLKSYSPVTVIAATTTTQTVNDGASASFIQFVDTVDTANSYSTGTFTVPYTGYYQINMSVYFSTTVTLNPGSFLTIDTNLDGTKQVVIFNGSWTGSYLHYSTVIPASAGDAIRVAIRQVSGGPIDISSSSRLAIHRVSIGA